MKLGEALSRNAVLAKQYEQLLGRIQACARYQEGEPPLEDAEGLLLLAEDVLRQRETLQAQINSTNASAGLMGAPGMLLVAALAARRRMTAQHHLLTVAADAASGQRGPASWRSARSELTYETALRVPQLRADADLVAESLLELNAAIERANWAVDLMT